MLFCIIVDSVLLRNILRDIVDVSGPFPSNPRNNCLICSPFSKLTSHSSTPDTSTGASLHRDISNVIYYEDANGRMPGILIDSEDRAASIVRTSHQPSINHRKICRLNSHPRCHGSPLRSTGRSPSWPETCSSSGRNKLRSRRRGTIWGRCSTFSPGYFYTTSIPQRSSRT